MKKFFSLIKLKGKKSCHPEKIVPKIISFIAIVFYEQERAQNKQKKKLKGF